MNQLSTLLIVSSLLLFSCFVGGKNEMEEVAEKIIMPPEYSLIASWESEYKSNKFTIRFNEDKTGTFLLDGEDEFYNFTWEEERLSKNRINITILVEDKSDYTKESLHMYNNGLGFSLKLEYIAKDEFKMCNCVFLKDGKLTKDDGKIILKQLHK